MAGPALGLSYAATCLYLYLISINIRSIIRAARRLLLRLLLLLRLRLGAGCTLCYLAILKMRLQQLFCCAMPLCNMRPKRTLANNMLLKSCHGNSSSSSSSRSSCRRTTSILFCSVFLAAAHIIKTKPKAAGSTTETNRESFSSSLPCPVLSSLQGIQAVSLCLRASGVPCLSFN